MTNAQTRIDIAAALTGVAGVTGHVVRPATLNQGDAWPQWRGGVRRAHAVENTWAVLIVLPGDDITADDFADSHLQALLDALRPHIAVDSIAPATIPGDSGDLYALLITGRSE